MYKVNYFLINLCISAMEHEEVLINQQFILRNEREIRIVEEHLNECDTCIKYFCTFFISMIIVSLSFLRVFG